LPTRAMPMVGWILKLVRGMGASWKKAAGGERCSWQHAFNDPRIEGIDRLLR